MGDPTVADVCALKYTPDGRIQYKFDFPTEWSDLPKPRKSKRKTKDVVLGITPLYNERLPMKQTKYQHLQQLKNVLLKDYHQF